MDATFLSSALTKVPDGAWFTLTLAAVLACILLEWRFGKEQQWKAEAADRFPTSHFVKKDQDGTLRLTRAFGHTSLSTIKGLGIFFDKAGETTPLVFSAWVSKLAAIPECLIFFHMRPLETPSVPPEERYTVSRLGLGLGYRLVLRHGFNDNVVTPDLAQILYEQVRLFIVRSDGRTGGPSTESEDSSNPEVTTEPEVTSSTPDSANKGHLPTGPTFTGSDAQLTGSGAATPRVDKKRDKPVYDDEARQRDLKTLDDAYNHQILYIIGKEEMHVKPGTGFVRTVLLKAFLWMRENSRTKVADLRVSTDRVIEVGFVKDV